LALGKCHKNINTKPQLKKRKEKQIIQNKKIEITWLEDTCYHLFLLLAKQKMKAYPLDS
jgi:hypothetical protein